MSINSSLSARFGKTNTTSLGLLLFLLKQFSAVNEVSEHCIHLNFLGEKSYTEGTGQVLLLAFS